MSLMRKINHFLLFACAIFSMQMLKAQDLLDILDQELKDTMQLTQATFKTTRLGFGHTVETRKEGILQFTLGTRYWNIPMETPRNSFVADRFSGSLGIEYSFSDRFTSGISVTSFDGLANLFGKYRLIQQQDGSKSIPIGLTLVQTTTLLTREFGPIQLPNNLSDRLVFTSQAIIARKFNRNWSFQIVPTYIHSNSLQTFDNKDQFALGFGGRYRLGNHTSAFTEYYYLTGREEGAQGYNSFFLGVNWEIGDVILQFSLSNAKSFDDPGVILYSPNNFNFNDGGLHFGFNLNYILHTKKRGEKK